MITMRHLKRLVSLLAFLLSVGSSSKHKVLLWGILGALLMRAVLIAAGVTLMQKFHWITDSFLLK